MGEVLSQSEIDNLLAQLSSGELDMEQMQEPKEKQVKDYDFKRPAKFSKEHLRTLEIIYEHYGRLLSTNLPVYLRKNVQATVASSETVTFSEFTNALSNPVILGIVDFKPLTGNVIIELAPNLGFDFSEIEMTIIQKMMIVCMQLMREPWKNVLDISPMLDRIETNVQFAQVIAPSDMIAIVTMNVKIGDVEGFMNVCLPFFTLEDIIDKLNTKYWFSTMKKDDSTDYEEQIESLIKRVDAPIRAVLGKSQVSVNDFLGLQCGDIIRLDTNVNSEMSVYVGNIRKFTALPGSSQDKYAVRITSVIAGFFGKV